MKAKSRKEKSDTKCCIKGCDKFISNFKHKLCNGHMTQFYRKGYVLNKPLMKRSVYTSIKIID